MATTFTKIASVSVGLLGASSIDFTSIPSTYTDLVVKLSARNTNASSIDSVGVKLNSNTSSYSFKQLYGTGSAAASQGASTYPENYIDAATATASTFANYELYIPNYAGSTNKSMSIDAVTENNATAAYATLTAGLWSNTAAITGITLFSTTGGGNFVQYSTATLYGINKS
jgi:hypothetical protein